jgi:hypothetical protein
MRIRPGTLSRPDKGKRWGLNLLASLRTAHRLEVARIDRISSGDNAVTELAVCCDEMRILASNGSLLKI